MARGLGSVQRKVLLLLFGGLALGLSGSPRRYFKILKAIGKEWEAINRDSLRKAIRRLYESRLITAKENPDGSAVMTLSSEGTRKARVLTRKLDDLRIEPPVRWDGKWRVVIFDIPTHLKPVREAFRFQLQRLGFYRLQKSVYVYPYECSDETDFLIEFFQVRRFVRQITAEFIDNALHLRQIFKNILPPH